jgi:hypothetical protein
MQVNPSSRLGPLSRLLLAAGDDGILIEFDIRPGQSLYFASTHPFISRDGMQQVSAIFARTRSDHGQQSSDLGRREIKAVPQGGRLLFIEPTTLQDVLYLGGGSEGPLVRVSSDRWQAGCGRSVQEGICDRPFE